MTSPSAMDPISSNVLLEIKSADDERDFDKLTELGRRIGDISLLGVGKVGVKTDPTLDMRNETLLELRSVTGVVIKLFRLALSGLAEEELVRSRLDCKDGGGRSWSDIMERDVLGRDPVAIASLINFFSASFAADLVLSSKPIPSTFDVLSVIGP